MSEAPAGNFADIRRTDSDQALWFLGEDYSGIPMEGPKEGAILGGNRRYVLDVDDPGMRLAVTPGSTVLQSLAQGGLGAAWGAECETFDDATLTTLGLPAADMAQHVEAVTREIGIAGNGEWNGQLPPLRPDHHAAAVLEQARRKEATLRRMRCAVRPSAVAILTEERAAQSHQLARRPYAYTDMEYFADPGLSVYRPQHTLRELLTYDTFEYHGGIVATRIAESDGGVLAHGHPVGNPNVELRFAGKRLILAAGAVGSARILLRSLGLYGTPVPFLGKQHLLTACLHPRMLGKAGPDERTSICQVVIEDEERTADGLASGVAQLYGYRSLQLLRMLSSAPLPVPESLGLLALLTPALMIADIRFPAHRSARNTLRIEKTEDGDVVRVDLDTDPAALAARKRSERRLHAALRAVGLFPLRTVRCGEGSSSHYGGTVPMSAEDMGLPLSVEPSGQLRQMSRVSVADGAVLASLPAGAPTLTIMANARRVALETLKAL
jgi:hypothetical protein